MALFGHRSLRNLRNPDPALDPAHQGQLLGKRGYFESSFRTDPLQNNVRINVVRYQVRIDGELHLASLVVDPAYFTDAETVDAPRTNKFQHRTRRRELHR